MKIENNTVVSVTYQLFAGAENAEKSFVETADKDHPFTFLFGNGGIIEGFETALTGLSKGDTFEFDITIDKAYGPIDPEAVVKLPIDIFRQDGKIDHEMLSPGNVLPMNDDEGNRLSGKIVDMSETEVTMDFNHPMAGQELRFSGEVLAVRAATQEEIDHGHVHDGTHHHTH